MAIKLLIGGSPCTHWSIAKNKDRETKASGQGWELFKNFLIAKDKFKPDYFLYENVKSAHKDIKQQIADELGVDTDPQTRLTYINSALVSAQNRERFYVTNFGDITQPRDRGIFLKDILETGETDREKSRAVTSSVGRTTHREYFQKSQNTMVAERVGSMPNKDGQISHSQGMRVYSENGKSVTLNALGGGGGAKTGLYAVAFRKRTFEDGTTAQKLEAREDEKSNSLTTVQKDSLVAEQTAKNKSIYEVKDGFITIKDRQYPIKLKDGHYIIRKLTPTECERLQTLPDGYTSCVSNTQRYKALGNGWTAEVIIHLLNHALANVPKNEEIIVLSLYDGIATGKYCLGKMGFTNITYYAYEIDKYAISVAMDNYPDIIQCGDAFAVREENWTPPQTRSEWLDDLLGGGNK